MSDFYTKIMYGNGDKKDFSPSDFPKTRGQVYKRLLSKQFGKLLCANLWMLLFCLPFFAWNILCLSYGARFDCTSAEGKSAYLNFLITVRYPLTSVFGVVGFIGFSGIVQVVRKLCWGLPVRTTGEFFKGIRSSWTQFLVIGILSSLLYCLFDLAFTALHFSSLDVVQRVLLYALAAFAAVLLCGGLMFSVNLCSTYRISLFIALKNSFLFTVKYILKTVGTLCVTVLPIVVLCVVGNIWTELAAFLLLAVFGFVHIAVVWHLFTNGVFDNHINKQNYPDFYRKGLAPFDATTNKPIRLNDETDIEDEIK